jgi:methylglutaconyl-CoA hydratase
MINQDMSELSERTVEIEQAGAVARVWMNRPAVHNALNEPLIDELAETFLFLGEDPTVRVIVLSGRGKSFSAGGDIEYMKQQGSASRESNLATARVLADMFRIIANSPTPTIARVNGAAMGGGLGLVAACDIAVASNGAIFAASEVRLGLIPSTIAPYVLRAIGPRQAQRLFQTGERIDAAHAQKIGLVHETAEPDQLDARIQAVIDDLLAAAPGAQSAAKDLIDAVADRPITRELIEETAVRIADRRADPEALEGLSAFLEKRSPDWVPLK